MGPRDWLKGRLTEANQAARAVVDERPQQAVVSGSEVSPWFPLVADDPTKLITQRRWSDPPRAAVSVMWRPVTRGGEGGVPTWFGETVDPLTFEQVDVFNSRDEAARRQAVLFAVAGTQYRLKVLGRPEFAVGRPVVLVPDPRNKYDPRAIEVRDTAGQHTVGFVPQDRIGETFAQRLLHAWLAQGPVSALILSERAWMSDDGAPTSERGGITVLAGQRIECVEIPAPGDDEHAEFAAARLKAKADAWPHLRMELRRKIDVSDDVEDRHFAIQVLIQEAYRLRDAHPEALDDAVAACREQINLAPRVAALMRQRYDRPLPAHVGFKQLAVILEKQKAYVQAAEVAQQARSQGWDGEWDKRLDRLHRKQP